MQAFRWPEGFRQRVQAFHRSNVALRNGRELIEEGTYRFRAFPPVTIDLFENWTENPVSNRSWQWHSASFNFMPWLLALHADTGDQRAIDHAAKGIETWHRHFVAVESNYEFAWHDHATANRVVAVLSLLCHLEEYSARFDLDEVLPTFLQAHGNRLCMDEMYSRHTNHGIDQSRALLLLATCAPWLEHADRWRQIAIARLEDELDHAFTGDGAHVENSPGYHQFVSTLFTDVLVTLGDVLDEEFRERVHSTLVAAARFTAWIVRPDGRLPPIGDTECKPANNVYKSLAGTSEHANVEWVCSKGQEGEKPEGWARTFPESGYFIARSDWDDETALPGDARHLVFRCGRLSDYHRHDDDLSLTLWWGSDWLVDGGEYAYVEGHPIRRYLRSKWAHNVVVIDDGAYSWARPGASAPGSLRQVNDDAVKPAIKGSTESYSGLRATRELAIEHDVMHFEVTDQLSALNGDGVNRKFVSLWHVPADKVVSIEGQCVRICDHTFMRELTIRNLGRDFDRIAVVEEFPAGEAPVLSRELNKFERCKLVVFERSCEEFESRLEFRLRDSRPMHRDVGIANARARGLFRSYCVEPTAWWPSRGAHHGRKVSARFAQAGKDGIQIDALMEELLAMAIVRQRRHRPTLHLSNMGYPDAGLIEPRLRNAMGMLPAGEVYLPAPVQQLIRDWSKEERLLFIDAVQLLHAAAKPGPQILNSLVNSSQGQHQEIFWRGDENAVRVLVLREPVDAALNAMTRSRPAVGWRDVADAEAALVRQVERLERFSVWAARQSFALRFRIEDFGAEPAPVLEEIGRLCSSLPDMRALAGTPRIEPLSAALTDSDLMAIHGFPVRKMLRERLANVRIALGYA